MDLFANRAKVNRCFGLFRMFSATMLEAVPTGVAIAPLAWALAVGTGIGGMATPVGTASNLVALNILNKPKQRLSFARFAKRSIPLTIIDLAIANLILLLRL